MHRVWLNADDLGLTEGVTQGILAALGQGALSTATAMVARPDSLARVGRLPPWTAGRIGLHLQLTEGTPLLPPEEVPSLVTSAGTFPESRQELKQVEAVEVYREWRAQLAAFRATGRQVSHLDSHHDVHYEPEMMGALLRLARAEGLVVRGGHLRLARYLRSIDLPASDWCETFGSRGPRTVAGLVDHLRHLATEVPDGGVLELACHPGHADEHLAALTRHPETREEELEVLLDPELPRALAAHGFELLRSPPPLGAKP